MKLFENVKKQTNILLVVCLCLLGTPAMVFASVPQLMSYQGILKDAQGNYLTGTYDMTFRIYVAATGETALWTETQSGVSAASGKFNVELGSVTALDLPFNAQYWLSVQVGSDPEMTPRVKLTSVGYAYNSEEVVNSFTESQHDGKSHMDIEGVKSAHTSVAKTNFKLDAYSSAAANNMGSMIVDAFNDESGIDTNNSADYLWQGSPDYSVTTLPAPNGIDDYTKLALHMNGSDGATAFTDSSSSNNSVTANGNAQMDTAASKFSGASGLFDGSGDYLSVPSSTDFNFGTGDFTIDFWVRFNTLASTYFVSRNSGSDTNSFGILYNGTNLVFYTQGSVIAGGGAWSATVNTWYHIAAVRSGTSARLYVNGVQLGDTRTNSTNISSSQPVVVGATRLVGGSILYQLNGWLDEVRISKGIARWTSNFTPPVSEYAPPGDAEPATVISTAFSETTAPTEAMVIGDETLNSGSITYSVSRDDGTTWTQVNNGEVVSLASQPSGTQVRWKSVITDDAELKGIATALT
ncbi:MAG: LamG domain-containing protein [Candidatus Omnitrophota bacterium]|jgi:hypothetical protein